MNSRRKLRLGRLFVVVYIAALIITLPFRLKQTAADEGFDEIIYPGEGDYYVN